MSTFMARGIRKHRSSWNEFQLPVTKLVEVDRLSTPKIVVRKEWLYLESGGGFAMKALKMFCN